MNLSRKRSAISPDQTADAAVAKKKPYTDTAPAGRTDFLEELLWKQSVTLTERFHGSSEILDGPETWVHVEGDSGNASSGGGSPDIIFIDMTGGSCPRQYSHDPLNLLHDLEQYERSVSVAQNDDAKPPSVKTATPQPLSMKTADLPAAFSDIALQSSSSTTTEPQLPPANLHALKTTSRLNNRVTLQRTASVD
ncbi:hypothetical protein AAVH_43353 [Aphelenchoides avenae]|nr:hypothetical protein AAVH_43353 [Aphelenchus avenae]